MFEGATNFIGDTSNWDLTRTTSLATENDIEYKLFNLPLPKSTIDIISGYTKTSIKIENISGDTKYLNIADFNNIIRGGELKTVDIYGVLKLVDPVMKFYGSTIETITGNVVLIGTVSQMFMNAVYFNSDLSGWNVSDVTDMTSMFRNASSFNSDISTWDVSNVRSMTYMFLNAVSFNQDISNWDVSNVMTMSFIFGIHRKLEI
jgi:surface protein